MVYILKNSAGATVTTVNDGTIDTSSTSLTFIGKSYNTYGTALNENFLYLLENFSNTNTSPPPFPLQGQLWWDSTNKFMNVYNGSAWITLFGPLASITSNSNVAASIINASSVYASTIGNTNASYTGTSGTFSGTVNANIFTANAIYAGTIGNTGSSLVGTLSSGAQTSITAVGTLTSLTTSGAINSGGTITGAGQIVGYLNGALGANTPNSVVATSVTTSSGGQLRGYFTGALGANTPNSVVATSVTTSSGGQVRGYITGAIGANTANTGAFTTITTTGTMISQGTISAPTVNAGTIGNSGAIITGTLSTAAQPNITSVGNLTGLTSSGAIIPVSNNSVTLGNATAYWSTVYGVSFIGTSTTAQYADLAEKYILDKEYPLGTVIMIGGEKEATQHDGRLVRAIGAVSTNPAYKMNDSLENGTYIALKGRVPVRVVGPVMKGQSLRGGPNGLAIAEEQSSPYTFAIAMESVGSIVGEIIEAVIL